MKKVLILNLLIAFASYFTCFSQTKLDQTMGLNSRISVKILAVFHAREDFTLLSSLCQRVPMSPAIFGWQCSIQSKIMEHCIGNYAALFLSV